MLSPTARNYSRRIKATYSVDILTPSSLQSISILCVWYQIVWMLDQLHVPLFWAPCCSGSVVEALRQVLLLPFSCCWKWLKPSLRWHSQSDRHHMVEGGESPTLLSLFIAPKHLLTGCYQTAYGLLTLILHPNWCWFLLYPRLNLSLIILCGVHYSFYFRLFWCCRLWNTFLKRPPTYAVPSCWCHLAFALGGNSALGYTFSYGYGLQLERKNKCPHDLLVNCLSLYMFPQLTRIQREINEKLGEKIQNSHIDDFFPRCFIIVILQNAYNVATNRRHNWFDRSI